MSTPPVSRKRQREEELQSPLPVKDPIAERAEAIARERLALTPPSTPPSSLPRTPSPTIGRFMPRTPGRKKQRTREIFSIFGVDPCQTFHVDALPFKIPSGYKFYLQKHCYYNIGERREICFQQPPQKSSCGAGVTLMLMSHFMDRNPELQFKETFWDWYLQSGLTNLEQVLGALNSHVNLSEAGYTPQGLYFYRSSSEPSHDKPKNVQYCVMPPKLNTFLDNLRHLQEETRSPLIVSITNPRIEGHWIIIDRIQRDGIFVREPYKGEPYFISEAKLFENWPKGEGVSVLFVKEDRASSSSSSSLSSSASSSSSSSSR